MKIKFVWDAKKADYNFKKHKVSFEEAQSIFLNFPIEIFFDPDHSFAEERYIAFGFSEMNRILMVVHIENLKGTEIRIISARKATNRESKSIFGAKK